ncbi:MAG TPA: phytoene desaturase, partial [Flavobacteriales bacterium]|nr:phytoene desaturase [Flavobacteriales bacterium]
TEIEDNESAVNAIYNNIIKRLESYTGEAIGEHVIFKKQVAKKHFKDTYNAFKGNAYGLANTLMQTATLKPKMVNKKVNNLFYTGQLTVPGPGVPPSIISGEIAAKLINNQN